MKIAVSIGKSSKKLKIKGRCDIIMIVISEIGKDNQKITCTYDDIERYLFRK